MWTWKLLLSINCERVENILRGTKKLEFRKVGSRRPVRMIVGEVEVTGTVGGSPEEVWQQTAELAGISKEFVERYYACRDKAIAHRLGEVSAYEDPKRLADDGVASASQWFVCLPS